jgi:hypothetical protein
MDIVQIFWVFGAIWRFWIVPIVHGSLIMPRPLYDVHAWLRFRNASPQDFFLKRHPNLWRASDMEQQIASN